MKTVAELKRNLTVGTVLTMTWHAFGAPKIVGIARTIQAVKSFGIEIGEGRSRLEWPKTSEVQFFGEDQFTILEDCKPLMSYRIG